MKILHYSLGLPPFRTGGMTKYCIDLMKEEIKKGHEVSFVYPGILHNKRKKVKVKSKGMKKINDFYINECFEIINPIPIPLLDGIKNVELFQIKKDINVFNNFFKENSFDVIHVHTFMGMPHEFLESAQKYKIKLVYTTHDYFPICPRGNLFNDGKKCIEDNECFDCIQCNQNALSYKKMYFLQSNLYKVLKDMKFIRKLRKRHNNKLYIKNLEKNNIKKVINLSLEEKLKTSYQRMRKNNIDWLNKFDIVHFNSGNTFEIYKKYGKNDINAKVVSISNEAVKDKRKQMEKIGDILKFGYLGPATTHKGYELLISSCDYLWENGIKNFEIHTFNTISDDRPYIRKHSPYKYEELEQVMEYFNVLVVPSLCEETFGFTTLEALSFAIPVIVTKNVGAKDLIFDNKNGYIVNDNTNALANSMKTLILNHKKVLDFNTWIVKNGDIKNMSKHSGEILNLYKGQV